MIRFFYRHWRAWKIFNFLPNDKINVLDLAKFKAFADDKINVAEKSKFYLEKAGNIVGEKWENAYYRHFPFFFFQKASWHSRQTSGLCCKNKKIKLVNENIPVISFVRNVFDLSEMIHIVRVKDGLPFVNSFNLLLYIYMLILTHWRK